MSPAQHRAIGRDGWAICGGLHAQRSLPAWLIIENEERYQPADQGMRARVGVSTWNAIEMGENDSGKLPDGSSEKSWVHKGVTCLLKRLPNFFRTKLGW
jgi:hypothetical protein